MRLLFQRYLLKPQKIARRANLTNGTTKRKRIYSGRYAYPNNICAHCGDIFQNQWNNRVITVGVALAGSKRMVQIVPQGLGIQKFSEVLSSH